MSLYYRMLPFTIVHKLSVLKADSLSLMKTAFVFPEKENSFGIFVFCLPGKTKASQVALPALITQRNNPYCVLLSNYLCNYKGIV